MVKSNKSDLSHLKTLVVILIVTVENMLLFTWSPCVLWKGPHLSIHFEHTAIMQSTLSSASKF